MKTLTDMRLLFARLFFQYLRNPMFIIVNLTTPILYLVLLFAMLMVDRAV